MAKVKASRRTKKQSSKKTKVVKKSNVREKTKFAGLKPHLNLKTRADWLDMDYLDQLNDKEKAWLNAFVEEEINAKFNHSGKKFNKSKKNKRRIYSANNARNRCVFTRAKATFTLDPLHDATEYQELLNGDLLDLAEKIENLNNSLDRAEQSKPTTKKKN